MIEKVLLFSLLLVNVLIVIYVYKKFKIVLHHISQKHGEQQDTFIEYISKIERRISKPFKDFDNLHEESHMWVVVTSYNRNKDLKNTILSIRENEPEVKILVVDNGSDIETIDLLYLLKKEDLIDKLLLNTKADIPQWQKSFSMAQAMKVLSLEKIKDGITWIDDDIIVKNPWIKISESIIKEFDKEKIKIVTCHNDHIQEESHPTEGTLIFKGYSIHLKSSFNGGFFYTPLSFLKAAGLPPLSEGYSHASTEDWYYSRRLMAHGWKVATVNCSEHIGYERSHREKLHETAY